MSKKNKGPHGQILTTSPTRTSVVVSITWSRHIGDTWQKFNTAHQTEFGVYLIGDDSYPGSSIFRLVTQDQVYVGQCGGTYPYQNSSSSKKVNGSFGMRYYGRTYSNTLDAIGSINRFNLSVLNPHLPLIERPLFFGAVNQGDRIYIETIEAYYIHLYRQAASSSGYTLVNTFRKRSIPSLPSWLTINHVGSKPSLV